MEAHKRPSYKAILACLLISAMVLTLILVHTSGHLFNNKVIKYAYMVPEDMPHQKKNAVNQDHASETSQNRELKSEQFSSNYSQKDDGPIQGMLFGEGLKPDLKPKTRQYAETRDRADQFAFRTTVSQDAWQGDKTNGILSDMHRPQHQIVRASLGPTNGALQGAIRAKMTESARISEHAERNCYEFNDRNRTDYLTLPLRRRSDHEWKQDEAVIFNRVGKCGSRSVIRVLESLSDLNNFNLISSVVFNKTAIDSSWQKYIVQTLDAVRTPYLFQRHLHFVNFGHFNLRQPLYINIIRDPLNRFLSQYYFKRFGDGKSDRSFKGSAEAKNRSVTDCILQRYRECTISSVMYIIPFFCGQQKMCRKPSQWALDQAKKNVEKYFIVVGILEDLENTLLLLEKVLPKFFKGVVEVYKRQNKIEMEKMITVTKKKEKPSEEAKAIMKRLMRYDYDFYNWVKERYEKMKKQYGIVSGKYQNQN